MFIREIIGLIPTPYRKQSIWITLSAILQALLNLAGLTVLIPIVILVFNPTKLISYPWFVEYRNLMLIAIVCFIVLKNILNVCLGNIQIGLINKLYKYYSHTLYESYYRRGLLFVKNKHSDELAYNVNVVSYLFSHGMLSLTLSIVAETALLLFIWLGIFWYSPAAAFYIAVSFLPLWVIYFYLARKKLKVYGEKEDNAKRKIMTLVGDTFKGYSDVKLNDACRWFEKRFENNIEEISNSRKKITKAYNIPQGVIECYVVLGMIFFVIVAGADNEAKVTLGVLSIAILRILPSLRSLITMSIQWKNNAFTMDTIREIHVLIPQSEDKKDSIYFKKHISIDNISFKYPRSDKYILNKFTLKINKGECIGIHGMSGIGKTTLFNIILGFYEPTEGNMLVDNIPLKEYACSAWQRMIAYVSQDTFIKEATLAENIAFGAEVTNKKKIMELIEQTGLEDYVSSLPNGIDTKVGQNGSLLSGGERQRIGLARALYKKAEILLLDEATSSLDIKTEKEIMNMIYNLYVRTRGLTVILISHKKSSLCYCERIIKMGENLIKQEPI